MTRLKYIEACAFMPFEHIILEPPQGLVLIEGIVKDAAAADSNGSGKTSIFDIITWTTFAKTMRGLKGDEIINEFLEQGYTFGKTIWELDDEEELIIERYRKHSEFKDELHVSYSGTDISGPNAQQTIEDLLGVSFNTFVHSIMFGQEIARFGELGDVDRKKLLDEILDLEALERALKAVKVETKEIEKILADFTAGFEKINTSIEETQGNLDQYKQSDKEYKQKYEEELAALKLKLKHARMDQKKLSEDLKTGQESLKQIELVITKLKKKATQNNEAVKNIDTTEKDTAKEKQTTAHNEVIRLQREIGSAKILKAGTKCVTCKQNITEKHRDAVVTELEGRLEKAEKDEAKAKKVYEAAIQVYDKAKENLEKEGDKIIGEQSVKDNEKIVLDRGINALSIKVGAIDNEVLALSSMLENKENEKNPYKEYIKQAKERLEDLNGKLADICKTMELENNQLAILEFWKWGFGSAGLKSHILESITPMLNGIADKYSAALTGGDIRIQFQTREQLKSRDDSTEKFGFSVELPKGGSTYKHCSSGQKRRIDLIIMFALQNLLEAVTGFVSTIVFFDEVFDHLDSMGREFVLELLAAEAEKRETVFVITQETALRDYFQTVITVENNGGIASLVS
jgi:DNA repair exonuclease SbcCD ATPase subunit